MNSLGTGVGVYGAILAHEADEVCDLIWERCGKDISARLPSAAVVSKGTQGSAVRSMSIFCRTSQIFGHMCTLEP